MQIHMSDVCCTPQWGGATMDLKYTSKIRCHWAHGRSWVISHIFMIYHMNCDFFTLIPELSVETRILLFRGSDMIPTGHFSHGPWHPWSKSRATLCVVSGGGAPGIKVKTKWEIEGKCGRDKGDNDLPAKRCANHVKSISQAWAKRRAG